MSFPTIRSKTVDVEYRFSWGWDELEGIANRTDFDLKQHTEHSGEDLSYFDQAAGVRVTPYRDRTGRRGDPHYFRLSDRRLPDRTGPGRRAGGAGARSAPGALQGGGAASFPESPYLVEPASRIADDLGKRLAVEFDITQSIGRRYRRQDEIGTPLCVTYDFDSLEDQSVTVRHRDTMHQDRVGADRLYPYLVEHLGI